MESYQEWKKRRSEAGTLGQRTAKPSQSSTSKKNTGSGIESYSEWKARRAEEGTLPDLRSRRFVNTYQQNQERLRNYLEKAGSFYGSAKSDFEGTTWGTANDTYKKKRDDALQLRDEGLKLQSWLKENRDYLDPETYDAVYSQLSDINGGYLDLVSNFRKNADFYNQFDTEEDYLKWDSYSTAEKRQETYLQNLARLDELKKERDEMTGKSLMTWQTLPKDTTEIDSEINALEAEIEMYKRGNTDPETGFYYGSKVVDDYSQYLTDPNFEKYSDARDYGDYSWDSEEYQTDYSGQYVVQDPLGMFLQIPTEERRDMYESGSGMNNTVGRIVSEGHSGDWDQLSQDEIGIYYTILGTQGKDAAMKYLSDMTTELNRRGMYSENEQLKQQFDAADGWERFELSAKSLPAQIFGGAVSFGDDLYHTLAGDDINPYSDIHTWSNYAQNVRQNQAEAFDASSDWEIPGINFSAGDLYQAAMSTADMFGGAMLGPTAYGALMGMGAASSEARRLYEMGASRSQIAWGAAAAGAAEMLAEKYSIEKLISIKDSDTLYRLALNALAQGGIEASEEGVTELANLITNNLIMTSESDWARLVEKHNGDKTAAFWEAAGQVGSAAASGFVSGLIGGTGSSAMNYGQYFGSDKNLGAAIREYEGANPLRDLAMAMAEKETGRTQAALKKQSERVGKDHLFEFTHNRDVGRLYRTVQDTVGEANKADVANALQEKGYSKKEAGKIADAFYAQAIGLEASNDQQKIIGKYGSDENVQKVIGDVLFGSDSSIAKRNQNLRKFEFDVIRNSLLAQAQEVSKASGKAKTSEDIADEIDGQETAYAVADDGKAHLVSNPEQSFDIVGFAEPKNGKVRLRTSDGQVVEASDVQYASESEAIVFETISGMDIPAKSANILIQAFRSKEGTDAEAYAKAIQEAFEYGRLDILESELNLSSALDASQWDYVYRQGRKAAGKQKAKEQSAIRKKEKTSNGEKRKGTVHFDRKGRTFDAVRETSLKTLEKLAAGLGIDVYVYESYENESGDRVYLDDQGNEVEAPNGFYDPSDGSIHIDLNAGQDGKGIILFTASHELVHFIRQWSPAKFKVLANFLVEQYHKKGASVSDLIQQQKDKAKQNGRQITTEEAFEEMVADSMETMLTDGNVVQMMAELKQRDRTLWQEICDWFRDLVADLQQMADAYKGVKPETAEGRMVADMQDAIAVFQSLYVDALDDASESFRTTKNTTGESGADYSLAVKRSERIVDQIRKSLSDIMELDSVYRIDSSNAVQYTSDRKTDEKSGNEVFKLQGGFASRPGFGKVLLSKKGAVDTVYHGNGPAKQAAFPAIKAVIENGIEIFSESKHKGRNYDTVTFGAPIDFFGLKSPLGVVVKVFDNGRGDKSFYIHEICDAEGNYIRLEDDALDNKNSSIGLVEPTSTADAADNGIPPKSSIRNDGQKVNKKFSTRSVEKLDRDYMDAVNRGDMNAAQKMVDAVAKSAGFSIRAFHGSSETFNTFSYGHIGTATGVGILGEGFYFGDDKGLAKMYGSRVYDSYLRMKNTYHATEKDQYVINTAKLAEQGYDSVDMVIGGGTGKIYCVFYNTQIKSSDPVTYDDNGKVIPLSKRFDIKNPDIRYSSRNKAAKDVNAAIQKENTQLKDDVQQLKELLKLQRTVTGGTKFTKSSVESMAGILMQNNNAKGDRKELARMLNDLYEFIATSKELSWESVAEKAQPAVDWIRQHTVVKKELSQYAQDVLRDVRTSRISLNQSQREEAAYRYGSFNDFRKSMMGSVVIANDGVPLDIQWQEWATTYPDIFDAEITAADMPGALADVITSLRNSDLSMTEYAYHADMIEQDLLRQVYDGFWRVSTLRTVADVKQREINELKSKHYQKMNDLRQKHQEASEKMKEAQRERIKKLRQEYRDSSDKRIQEIKDRHKAAKAKVTESRAKREATSKLMHLVLDTARWIDRPKKGEIKVPDVLKKPYADFLNSIDLSSKRLAAGGDPTQSDLRMANAMSSLATTIERITAGQDPTKGENTALDSGYLDLPADFVQRLRDMTESITAMMDSGGHAVNAMSAQEVKEISKMIRTLNHAIREVSTLYANMRFANVQELGRESMGFMDSLGEIDSTRDSTDFIVWDNALPFYAFKRFGTGGESVFEGLMDAQDKLAFLAQEIFAFQEQTWNGKEAKEWSEDTHTVRLPSGESLTLTTADAMSIYCLSRRRQGLQHLLGGGVRVIGLQKGSKKAKDSRSALTAEDIDAISDSLNSRQKKVAEAIQDFMSSTCAEWGNEISMKRFLTREFTEEHYFPIESNTENMTTQDPTAQQSDLFRLLNISATKALTPNANNEVIIRNVFDVFTGHASDMARLNAFGMPLLDYMKWLNYREKTTNDQGQIDVKGVRKSMEKAYGTAAKQYVMNLIKDVNGRFSDGGDPSPLMKWMRSAKTASVGNSLRVATLQMTSYPRAALVLSNKNLALGLSKKPNIEKAKKYCGIALWKSFGFYDTNISRTIEDQMKGITDPKQKLIEWSLKGAEIGDALTWGYLWNACEYEVASTKKYKVGSEEFNEAVGKKLREVVYRTQVVDSMLTRSQLMRSKRGMAQEAAAFMSEPTLSANILMDAGFEFNMEKRRSGNTKAAWEKTGKYIGKAVAVYSIGQLTAALLESLWDAWRDDDDEEFSEKYLAAFKENLILDILPFNKIPIVSDVFEAVLSMAGIGFYSSDRMTTTWITNAVSAVDAWKDYFGDESNVTAYGAIFKSVKALSSYFGVSGSGLLREGVALWNNTAGAYDSTLKIRQRIPSKSQLGGELLDALIEGNDRETESLAGQFANDDEREKAIRAAIKSRFASGEIGEQDASKYLVLYGGLDGTEAHWYIEKWAFDLTNETGESYHKYDDFLNAVKAGENLDEVIDEYLQNGVSRTDLRKQITNGIRPEYIDATKEERDEMRSKIIAAMISCGYSEADAEEAIGEWDFEAEYGFSYSERKTAYLGGEVDAELLKKALVEYGGYDPKDADLQIQAYDWEAEGYEGVSSAAVKNYQEYCAPANVPKDVYLHIRKFANNTENDVVNGEKVPYSAVKKIMREINSQTGLTSAQKTAIARSIGWKDSTIQKYKLW